MKTYTRDEIKRIMIDRPGEVFIEAEDHYCEWKYDEFGKLLFRNGGGFTIATSGLLDYMTFYIIKSEREAEEKAKKYELPKSVKAAIEECGWDKSIGKLFTAYHTEVVKLLEERK